MCAIKCHLKKEGRFVLNPNMSLNKYPLYHAEKLWMPTQFRLVYLCKALHSRRHLSFLCKAPTRNYTPKRVLLMQKLENWHATEFHRTQNTASEEVKFPMSFSGEPLLQMTSASAAPQVPVFDNRREACGSSPPQLNHIPHLWAMQQQISWAAFCWGSRRGKQRDATPLSLLVGGSPGCFSSQVPCWGQSCWGLWMESHSGTDPNRETARVQPWTVLNPLVNLREVTPGPCNDLTPCTRCIMHVTSIETEMMRYINECCSGEDMHQFDSSQLKPHRSHRWTRNILSSLSNN